MAGFRKPELPREQMVLWSHRLEEAIPVDHPVRQVAYLLESDAFRATFRQWAGEYDLLEGQPPYHPRDLTGLYIYGMLNRLRSSRQLEAACWNRLDVIWLMSGQHPDHSTIAAFVKQHGKYLQRVFRDTVRAAVQSGLVKLEHVSVDGTRIEADAGRGSVRSEGTLAVVTEVTVKLQPKLDHRSTLLVPFATLDEVAHAVPRIVGSGVGPLMTEYIDLITMAGITEAAGLDLGLPQEIKDGALAYLVVALEARREEELDADTAEVAELVTGLGALDVYVLPPGAATQLIEARERAFWVAKANGANDIVDTVVPRASIPAFLTAVSDLAAAHDAWVVGCGHAGDGNVHLSIFQADDAVRATLIKAVFRTAIDHGGAISGEHGIGSEKRQYFLDLEDPAKLALMRRIKAAFDPHGILNPGTLLDATPEAAR